MNINDYRRAMDRIVPDDALKERIMEQRNNPKKRTPARRVFTAALAAALTVACLFTVAFAASPEFRTAVLSFFHMEEREQVPNQGGAASEPDISQADIGALVKAQYIKMDKYYGLSGGLLTDLTWSEDRKTLLDAKFWKVKDNELIPVEVDMQTGQVDITNNGVHYQGEFWWFVYDGKLDFFTSDNRRYDEETELEWDWTFSFVTGHTDVLLLHLSTGTQMEYREHSFLYHLDTGETEDLFTGVDPDVLAESDGAIWSDNTRRALITGHASAEYPNGREWLYDRETGTLTEVKDLGGVGAGSAVFVDNDTLSLRFSDTDQDGGDQAIACWFYDIPSGQAVQTLALSPYYHEWDEDPYGIIPFYGGWAMEIGRDGSACLINLVTGERTALDNFVFQKGMDFFLNPSCTKLFYCNLDGDSKGLGVSQLGVIDLERMTFIAFDREGYQDLQEGGIVWVDDNTIGIRASTLDDETQYLLLYTF